MGKKGRNRLIYHSIYLLQTVIFVVKKFLSGFDGQIYKGKKKAQQNKINGAKVIFQSVQETARKGLGEASLIRKTWNCIFNNRSCVILTFSKLLK